MCVEEQVCPGACNVSALREMDGSVHHLVGVDALQRHALVRVGR